MGSRRKKPSGRLLRGILRSLKPAARTTSARQDRYPVNRPVAVCTHTCTWRSTRMKKLWIATLSIFLALPLMALAQDPAQSNSDPTKQSPSTAPKSTSVKGTISQDGKSIVSDTDGKSWTIANPDAVKGHEGHHVELKGTTDAGTGEIQVSSVKMVKGEKGAMKKETTEPK